MILNPTEPRLQPCCECCANQERAGCRRHQATNKQEWGPQHKAHILEGQALVQEWRTGRDVLLTGW